MVEEVVLPVVTLLLLLLLLLVGVGEKVRSMRALGGDPGGESDPGLAKYGIFLLSKIKKGIQN